MCINFTSVKSTHPLTGLGIMSGTSTDGIDLALCTFNDTGGFSLLEFDSIPYSTLWKEKLKSCHLLSGLELKLLENEFTRFTADAVIKFQHATEATIDFIGAHGHTVFHQPKRGLTYQMLNGALLAAQTFTTVVCDFRRTDLALGGQGAPLVPIGDRLLFGDYAACINIGGFANVSFEKNRERIAFDISVANLALNLLAHRHGKLFDAGGTIAAGGKLMPDLLDALDALPYYKQEAPKSLGREWFEEIFIPILEKHTASNPDLLHTVTIHIAGQISRGVRELPDGSRILITGGGTHNTFLIDRIRKMSPHTFIVPEREIIDAKEAIIFALLGKLRLEKRVNTLASVTGAHMDSIGGAVYLPA